jgi:hypothetical protein
VIKVIDEILAGHVGELQIEEEEVSPVMRKPVQRFLPVIGDSRVKSVAGQTALDERDEPLIVVNDQDSAWPPIVLHECLPFNISTKVSTCAWIENRIDSNDDKDE